MDKFNLSNKNIVVTGASSGIGRATSILLSQSGARLILVGRNIDRLKETYDQLEKREHLVVQLDLCDYEEVGQKFKKLMEEVDEIHGLINAAGVSITLPFKLIKPKKIQDTFEANVFGAMNLTRILTRKVPASGMSIVFLSSVMANVGEKAKSLYSMTKGALLSGSRSLAVELAEKKVRVNCISPGVVETSMTVNAIYNQSDDGRNKISEKHPLGIGKPEDIAYACLYLISDASRWVTGTDLRIDGGYTAL